MSCASRLIKVAIYVRSVIRGRGDDMLSSVAFLDLDI